MFQPVDYASASPGKKFMSAFFNALAEDEDNALQPEKIKKVFCSQSVVLMLRYALDAQGQHATLLENLSNLNSRLVSPRQVHDILVAHGASKMSNEELHALGKTA